MLTRERPSGLVPGPAGQGSRSRIRALGVAGLALVVVLAFAGLQRLLPLLRNPFSGQRIDRTQPAVLRAIENLSEYQAASGQFQIVIDLENNVRYVPSFIKGERVLFVAAGSVDANVDFSRIGSNAVTVSQDRRTVTITLPHAALSDAKVDPARSYVYDRDRGLIDRLESVFSSNPTSERELYLLAEKKLSAAAAEGGITKRAEANTRQMLDSLLRSLGFTDITVTYG